MSNMYNLCMGLIFIFSVNLLHGVGLLAGPNDHDENGDTPFIKAIFEQNVDEVKRLMEEGGDPRVKKADGEGSGYDFAFWGNNPEIKKLVINYQDPQTGETLLIKEIFNGDVLKVKEYLAMGADPYLQKKDGVDAIDFAIWGNSRHIQDLLVNYQDPTTGETPLIKAVFKADVDKVKTLLNNGAQVSLKKNDGAGVFEFLDWITEADKKNQIEEMLYASLDDKRLDNKGNFVSTQKLLAQKPDAQILQPFMQILMKATGVDRYVINVEKCPFAGRYGPPAAPVFHKYHGQGYYALSIKFPKEFLINIPDNIKEALLKFDLDEIELYMVVQGAEDDLLFRPHYWVNPTLPDRFNGVIDRNFLWVAMFDATTSIAGNKQDSLVDNQLKIFEFVTHDSRISPENASVKNLDPNTSVFVWTLTINNDQKNKPKKAAVTLHALMDWADVRRLGQTLDAQQNLQNFLQLDNPSLKGLIEQLMKILKV